MKTDVSSLEKVNIIATFMVREELDLVAMARKLGISRSVLRDFLFSFHISKANEQKINRFIGKLPDNFFG